jgi:hypothetical protein
MNPIIPTTSPTELAKFLEQQADKDRSLWKPTGYVSYPRLIDNLERYLKSKAAEHMPKERVNRLWIKTTVSRETGSINVEITERQPHISRHVETGIIVRACSAIVKVWKWIA